MVQCYFCCIRLHLQFHRFLVVIVPRRKSRQLASELFVFPFEPFDVHILWSPQVSLDVFNRIRRPFWFFVQAYQDFCESLQDTRLFQIFSEFLLFGTIGIVVIVAAIVGRIIASGVASRVLSGICLLKVKGIERNESSGEMGATIFA